MKIELELVCEIDKSRLWFVGRVLFRAFLGGMFLWKASPYFLSG